LLGLLAIEAQAAQGLFFKEVLDLVSNNFVRGVNVRQRGFLLLVWVFVCRLVAVDRVQTFLPVAIANAVHLLVEQARPHVKSIFDMS
jgi:hypothetical protein